ncbi:MAG: hypothetical protein JSV84_02165 [Gemmatimonadota bacterium]|nr:MAG: hypothetical protein JSV84_02165 [Gemmatimonadota bacterium]
MKKCYIIAGTIVLLFCLRFFVSAQLFDNDRTKGDVNGDGVVNILDAIRSVEIVLGIQSPPSQDELWAADCNGDEQINVLDVLGVVNVALEIGTCLSSCEELDCDDGNPCTEDYCDSLLIRCVHNSLPSGMSCDDGDPCTENDICQNGICVGTPTDCIDRDGITYQTVMIGDQCWMAENLKVTHYRNGDPIPNVTVDTEWANLTSGAYCDYDNNADNVSVYGRLYNWYAVDDNRNIAPEGWHVPSDDEWKQLELYLGMSQSEADDTGYRGTDQGGKLKATGTIEEGTGQWHAPNAGATNETDFSAMPGGACYSEDGTFNNLGFHAPFWSSTKGGSNTAWGRSLGCVSAEVCRNNVDMQYGFSVRCVRD